MGEIEEKIIDLRKQGYSLKKISDMIHVDYKLIRVKNKELMDKGKLTENDIKKGKDEKKRKEYRENPITRKIFELKLQGLSDSKIAKFPEIPKTQSEVSSYVREGKRLGLIDEKEIKEAIKKREEEEKENNPDRKRIIEGLRRGELDTQIAKDTTIGYQQVKNIKISLIKEGIITEEEIEIARKKARETEEIEKNDNKEDVEVDKEKILSYLILGYDTRKILYKTQIGRNQYEDIVGKLTKEGRITKDEIKEYRKKREEEEKEKVLDQLKEGKAQREIAKTIQSTLARVQTYIRKIKEENNFTDEDILFWKEQQEDSTNKKKEATLQGLKRGLSRREIIEEYPKQNLTVNDIKNLRDILVQEKAITENEIKKYRDLKKQMDKEKSELTVMEKRVCQYLKKGYEAKEIAEVTEKSLPYVYAIISRVKEKKKITKEEIEQARKQRKEKIEKEKIEREKIDKTKKIIQEFNQLKREIEIEVKLNKKPTIEKKEKIRKYIDLCYEIYRKENITKMELQFLSNALKKVQIRDKDIIEFVRQCIPIREYQEASRFIRNGKERLLEEGVRISKETENKLEALEATITKMGNIQYAIQMISKGNTITEVVASLTGLTKEEVNILKIKLDKRPVKLLTVLGREKVLEQLLKYKDADIIKRKMQMTDLEMEDIQQQAEYRKIKNSEEKQEIEIKKDSMTRIIVLLTKLGKKQQTIAKGLQINSEDVKEKIGKALEVGLIQEEQLQGVQLLASQELDEKQWQI